MPLFLGESVLMRVGSSGDAINIRRGASRALRPWRHFCIGMALHELCGPVTALKVDASAAVQASKPNVIVFNSGGGELIQMTYC